MELYQLKPSTLELVKMLREARTIGPHNYERQNGKTTALLLRAKELLDTIDLGSGLVVIYLCNDPKLYHTLYKALMPHADKIPLFSQQMPKGYTPGSYVLVDEPSMLKFTPHDWDYIGRNFNVLSVGRWF